MTSTLATARLVVVKVGSALLVDQETGALKRDWLKSLSADIADLKRRGKDVIVVSSGAIALGRRVLGLKSGTLRLEESQAAAAAGQVKLAEGWADTLAAEDIVAAQVLLTLADTEERRQYLNARATLRTLLSLGAVPVINENDTVATQEIRFGDNDRLSARVASMMAADLLILLSDVDGFYSADPLRVQGATHMADVAAITPEIEAMASEAVSGVGRGGMAAKLVAAKIATSAGANVVVTLGTVDRPIAALAGGGRSTLFRANGTPQAARKRWIAGGLRPQGTLIIDEGAVKALAEGRSLLPAGVRAIEGRFARGDAVVVRDLAGNEVARGLAAYGAADADRIKGKRSLEIEGILGYRGRDEIVHRDDLALTRGPK